MADTNGHSTPIHPPLATPGATSAAPESDSILNNKLATVALIGIGAALIEVELIPGMLLGVAAMAAPNLLPKLGRALRPLFKETVRAGYSVAGKARESVAEMGEQFQDIVAEVKSEGHTAGTVPIGHNEEAPATGTPEL